MDRADFEFEIEEIVSECSFNGCNIVTAQRLAEILFNKLLQDGVVDEI
jgi:hypothetical protein